jgi:hypothetical protein
VATSTGSLEFYNFDSATARLEKHSSKQVTEPSTLVLDLLWHPSRADVIAVTLSDGAVSLCQSSVDDKSGSQPWRPSSTVTTTELATHSLEPWTLAFSPDAELLFSGGDDAVLQALKLRPIDTDTNARSEDDEDATAATLLWTDRKSHEAGVTSILPLANDLLITGSYDDRIRLLSAPAVGRRKVLAELDLGGGVWRLKMLGSGHGQRYVTSFFFPCVSVHPIFFPLLVLDECSQTGTAECGTEAVACVSVRCIALPCGDPADMCEKHHTACKPACEPACLPAVPLCCHLLPTCMLLGSLSEVRRKQKE